MLKKSASTSILIKGIYLNDMPKSRSHSAKREVISMENRIDKVISVELRKGIEVTCRKCGKGLYKPTGADYKTAHSFLCNKCNDEVRFTPNVTVE